MADFVLFIGVLLALVLFVVLPGFLLWRFIGGPRKVDYSYLVGPALGLGVIISVFSLTAVVYRYDFLLFLVEIFLIIILLFFLLHHRGRLSFSFDIGDFFKKKDGIIFFFIFIFVFFAVPSLVLVVPLDTDAQGFGFYSLTVRESGTIDTLSPYFEDVSYLYSPGFFILTAFLSDFFGEAPIHSVMLVFSHLLAVVFFMSLYHLGRVVTGARFAVLMVLTGVFGFGLFTSVMDSHYTTVLAFAILPCFLSFFFRNLRKPAVRNEIIGGLLLGAICLSHPDSLIILLIAFIPFYLFIFFSKESIVRQHYLRSFILIPLIGVLVSSPWLLSSLKLFLSPDIMASEGLIRFGTSFKNWTKLLVFNGVLIPIIAVFGSYFALKRRRFEDVFMLVWIIAVIEFSILGVFEWFGQTIGFDITHHFYPPNIAWAGSIIPFAFLSALALKRTIDSKGNIREFFSARAKQLSVLGIVLCVLAGIFSTPIISLSKEISPPIFGAFSTEADVEAMIWIKENTPEEAVILNYPIRFSGHWVPVISERRTIVNRVQPFFIGFGGYEDIQDSFKHSLKNKDFEGLKGLIQNNDISYVAIPQLLNNPSAYKKSQIWQKPELINMTGFLDSSGSFRKVYDNEGAMVYEVV